MIRPEDTTPVSTAVDMTPNETAPIRIWLRPLPPPDATLGLVERNRARKRIGNALVRDHLDRELPGIDHGAMRRGPNGKPYLPPPFAHWGFNPSDSGDWQLFGLVEGADIGVDLEIRRPRPKALAIAQRHFPQAEVDWLQAQPDLDHAFLRLWTMKEALFKAIGRGLGYGLGKPCFQPDDTGLLHLAQLEGPAAPAAKWSCAELDLGPDHVGAAVWSPAVARPVSIQRP